MKASDALKKATKQALAHGEFKKDYPHKKRVKRIEEALEHIEATYSDGIMSFPLIPLVMILAEDGMAMATIVLMMIGILDGQQAEDA